MKTMERDGVDTCSTGRLLLQRPTIHADPMTNGLNPYGPATVTSSESMLLAWIAHWGSSRFGHWAISSNEAPEQIIRLGVIARKNVVDRLGLKPYFRFAPKAWEKVLQPK
jgi:hypothetical protein